MKKVKAIIAGGRDIECAGIVHMAITEAVELFDWDIVEVVSGGARGVDSVGEALARLHGKKVKLFKADWYIYGKVAGPIRNRQMAQYADVLILIWDGRSPGSKNMLEEMTSQGKPIYQYIVSKEDIEAAKL